MPASLAPGDGELHETRSDGVPDTQLDDDDYDVVDDISIQRRVSLYAQSGGYDNVPQRLDQDSLANTRAGVHFVYDQRNRARFPSTGFSENRLYDDEGGLARLPRFPRQMANDAFSYLDGQPTQTFGNRKGESEDVEEEVDVVQCPVTVTVTGQLCGDCGGDGHHARSEGFADSPNDSVLDCQHCPCSEG